ncbi:hypothetical protein KPH14_013102 [Odynerus spinipes]|uniref:Uncharacterized protein n=1 Tax=Odynerus spinipes TaxID=1348599 RepID=A0AAD9R8F7_9HYME|nr:hypothetical protein KPH14_013102 [Odynerus spinipes]
MATATKPPSSSENESKTVDETFNEITIEPNTSTKNECDRNEVVVTNENFDNCTLKKRKRFRCYWRMIGALHDMGHALTRLPCIAEQPDDSVEKGKRKVYITEKQVL